MKIKPLELVLAAAFLILVVLLGWLTVADLSREVSQDNENQSVGGSLLITQSAVAKNSGQSPLSARKSAAGDSFLARPKERLVQFKTEEDYRRFLASLGSSNLRLLGSLDSLRAVRVGFDDLADFDGLVDPDELGFNYLVSLPLPPGEGQIQAGAVGFRGNALDFLGITSDNSVWGDGVLLAVLDTGITSHEALPENIRRIDLIDTDGTTPLHGHGTAVASLIAGTNNLTPGVSPAVTLLDVRVAATDGGSTSFLLAEGIVAAVDAGAEVINISLGSAGNSVLVANAVDYATENGAVIVSSSGNEGADQPSFPAGYEDVYAVGAVDREGTVVDFSNTGENLDLTAPGLEVFAAWTDNRYIEFTGTSASSPYVAAAVATAISEFNLSPIQAAEYVLRFTNEAGNPGVDPSYGLGNLDVGRVINSETPQIFDIAAVSNLIEIGERNSVVTVVQNQGTESISSAQVNISTPFARIPLQVARLAPGEIQTFEVPTALPNDGREFFVTTEASLTQDFQDFEPQNNIRSTTFDLNSEP